jgi:hypothetical protein
MQALGQALNGPMTQLRDTMQGPVRTVVLPGLPLIGGGLGGLTGGIGGGLSGAGGTYGLLSSLLGSISSLLFSILSLGRRFKLIPHFETLKLTNPKLLVASRVVSLEALLAASLDRLLVAF